MLDKSKITEELCKDLKAMIQEAHTPDPEPEEAGIEWENVYQGRYRLKGTRWEIYADDRNHWSIYKKCDYNLLKEAQFEVERMLALLTQGDEVEELKCQVHALQKTTLSDQAFISHIQEHIDNDPDLYGQEVICKICDRTARDICNEHACQVIDLNDEIEALKAKVAELEDELAGSEVTVKMQGERINECVNGTLQPPETLKDIARWQDALRAESKRLIAQGCKTRGEIFIDIADEIEGLLQSVPISEYRKLQHMNDMQKALLLVARVRTAEENTRSDIEGKAHDKAARRRRSGNERHEPKRRT